MKGNSQDILAAAARAALYAPSLLNTQPWLWHLGADQLELVADRERQVRVTDPEGRFLLLSCGIAVHHACVSIAAAGRVPLLDRLVTHNGDSLIARLRVGPPRVVDIADEAMSDAIRQRRTDRRPFGDNAVPTAAVDAMRTAAVSAGVQLHQVGRDQMPMLAIAAGQADALLLARPDYRVELMRWTNRPEWSRDGLPAATTTRRAPRRVPMRTLSFAPHVGMPVLAGGDRGTAHFIVYGASDDGAAWFRAGEATSAVMLMATALALAISPMTHVVEVEHPRDLVRGLLHSPGFPYIVLRCGWPTSRDDLPAAPRRDAHEAIVVDPGRRNPWENTVASASAPLAEGEV